MNPVRLAVSAGYGVAAGALTYFAFDPHLVWAASLAAVVCGVLFYAGYGRRWAMSTLVCLLFGIWTFWDMRVHAEVLYMGELKGYSYAVSPTTFMHGILSRCYIGLAVGLSPLRIHYLLHGPLVGAVFGLALAIEALNGGVTAFVYMLTTAILAGLMTEIAVTKGLRLPRYARPE